jgi:hypothetical protein
VHLDGSPVPDRAIGERVKSILASKRLTLYEASQRSITLFGRLSPYYVPHNLYYDLRRETYSPSLFQLFALSQISGYSLSDWLRVFGFETEWIPRLQLQLPSERTVLVDSFLSNPDFFVPWLRDLPNAVPPVGVFPLSQVLEWTRPRHLGSLQRRPAGEFLYAKIGHADALAFPDLLPGSIARVRRGVSDDLLNRFSWKWPNRACQYPTAICQCRVPSAPGSKIGRHRGPRDSKSCEAAATCARRYLHERPGARGVVPPTIAIRAASSVGPVKAGALVPCGFHNYSKDCGSAWGRSLLHCSRLSVRL